MRDGYLPIYSRQNRLESPIYTDRFWAPRQSNNWNGMLKWTWNMSTRRKFSVTASRNVIVSQGFSLPGEGYPMDFIDGLDRYLVFTNENILTQAYYREVISENSWFELTLGRNFSRMHNNVNGNDDFTTYEPYNGWDDNVGQNDILGQAEGSADRWHDHYVESYTAKGTYSFMGSTTNKFKTGFELSFTEMQLVDLQGKTGLPPAGRLATYEDMFRASPVTAAAFFQDTIEYRGLVVNAGIRADVWAPGPEVDYAMAHDDEFLWIDPDMAASYDDKTFSMFGRRWKGRISPRLGLSFPVTPKDKFFFNYGHFNQWPRFAYVYPQLQATTVTAIQLLGNPNLDPKVTVEYETGMQHEFDGLWSLGLTMFNRDIYGYAKSTRLNQVYIAAEDTPDPNDSSTLPVNPVRYFNGDSARSIGMELSIVKRTTRWLSGSASLELQRTTGTNSSADEAYLQARYSEYEEGDTIESSAALTRGPLIWDKPWAMSLNVDFSVFDKERPEIFGWRTPANWSANLLVTAESGQRYTPYLGFTNDDPINGKAIDGELNSAIGPYRSSVNLRLNKFWRYAGGGKVTVYLEARNIFNHKNYRRVNPWTGKGYELGDYNPTWSKNNEIGGVWADTNSEAYAKTVVNPSYIENPRLLLWGVSYSW